MCVLAEKSSCESQAGRRSSGCCRRSMPSSRSASTRQTPVLITGGTFSNRLAAGEATAPLQPRAASGMDAAQEDRRMTCLVTIDDDLPGGGLWWESRCCLQPAPKLIWNASAQACLIGLYFVTPTSIHHVGDLVVVRPPEALAAFPRHTRLPGKRRTAPKAYCCPSRPRCLSNRPHDHRRWDDNGPCARS